MARILQSDQVVSDPNGLFSYLSDFGIVGSRLGLYLKAQKEKGYVPTQPEFDALKKLDDSINTLGIWGNILEFMPMMGASFNALSTKFKFKNNNTATPINSFNGFEANKGFVWATQYTTTSRGLDLKITQNDVLTSRGFGIIVYSKLSDVTPSPASNRIIAGGGNGTITATGILAQGINAVNFFLFKTLNAITATQDIAFTIPSILISNLRLNSDNTLAKKEVYENAVLRYSEYTATAINLGNIDATRAMFLGCRSEGISAVDGYHGSIRLFAITDGSLNSSQVTSLNTILSTFIAETGKTFV